jgi:hypothetical protein
MEAYSNGTARIRHRETGRIYEIDGLMLDWEIVDSDERQMGPEFHHEAVFEHPELGRIAWGLWEYPVGAENDRKTDAGPHEVVEDIDYGLAHAEEYSDDWFEPPPPDDPFTVFMGSYHGSSDLLAQSGSSDGGHLVNRLVFSHQVTALEAYLGDTLKNEVLRDQQAMQRLIEQDSDLKSRKFTLAEIAEEPKLIERTVRESDVDSIPCRDVRISVLCPRRQIRVTPRNSGCSVRTCTVARAIGAPSTVSFSQSISRSPPVSGAKRPSSLSQRRSSALRSASEKSPWSHFTRSFPGHIRNDKFL